MAGIAGVTLFAATGCHTARGAAAGFGHDVEAAGAYVSQLGQRLQAYTPRPAPARGSDPR